MDDPIATRLMLPGEEAAVLALVERVFHQFVAGDLDPEGVREFLKAARSFVLDTPPNHFVVVAAQGDEIVGMIDVKDDDHVSLFFVDPARHGEGLGRRLLEAGIDLCRTHRPGVRAVDVHSSLWAVPVYAHLGFEQTHPEQEINGIRFVTMVLDLSR